MKNLILILITSLILTGCSTTNKAGRVLATTTQTVDAAMKGWARYVVIAKPGEVQEKTVREAYTNYQLTEQIAENAYLVFVKTGDDTFWQKMSEALKQSESQLLTLIDTLSK